MRDARSDGFPSPIALHDLGLQVLTGKLTILAKICSRESRLNHR